MSLSRRNFLKILAASSAAIVVSSGLQGCDLDSSDDPKVNTVQFNHGVASGDPLTDSVIIWTRATPSIKEAVTLGWEVATDPSFTTSSLVNSDSTAISSATDYTLKVDVKGLNPGQSYYYRFKYGTQVSPIGKTKTLPNDTSEVKMAIFSCANFPAGYFHVYQHAADSADNIDVVLHLGDYIYEYDTQGYPDAGTGEAIGRMHLPTHECVLLDDYRTRYAQYRSDNSLQALHQKVPFICVWDDHEIANDTYESGAENHNEGEGEFETRKNAAIQAWYEWLPVRAPQIEADRVKTWRRFDFGNLASIMMLDTRVYGRDKQLDYAEYINTDGTFKTDELLTAMSDQTRTLLGADQLAWVQTELQDAKADGIVWQVLGQQVLMGRMSLPASILALDSEGYPDPQNLVNYQTVALAYQALATAVVTDLTIQNDLNTYAAQITGFATMTESEQAIALTESMKVQDSTRYDQNFASLTTEQQTALQTYGALLDTSTNPFIPYNLDAWDGYAVEREVLLGTVKAVGNNLVVLAGDTHNGWANNLKDQNGDKIAVEFATSSVSSPGMEKYLKIAEGAEAATEAGVVALVSDLQFFNSSQRGYLMVTLNATEAKADWYVMPRGAEKLAAKPEFTVAKSFKSLVGNPELVAV